MADTEAIRAEALLKTALDIGAEMLYNGAEVYRVEDSIGRLCFAYGAKRIDVFAIPSSIVATLEMEGGLPVTQTRRIIGSVTDMDRISRLNDLCRRACRLKPAVSDLDEQLRNLARPKSYGITLKFVAYMAISFAFAYFFGGTWGDAAASAIGGALLLFVMQTMRRILSNATFMSMVCAAFTAACAVLAVHLGIGEHVDKIVIGNIMLLIPGIELTNGMRDLVTGDMLAGLLHILEALFLATIIALGTAFMLNLLGGALQ